MKRKLISTLLIGILVFNIVIPISSNALINDIEAIQAIVDRYDDIPEGWSSWAIMHTIYNGLLQGDENKIRPKDNLTRAQLAAMLNRALNIKDKADISEYSDVKEGKWYYDDIAKAVKTGLLKGYDDKKIYPDNFITREEAFVVVSRAFKVSELYESKKPGGFGDIDLISDWAEDDIYSMVQAGFVSGSDGNIEPKNEITREQFVQIIYNIISNYVREPGVKTDDYEGNTIVNSSGVEFKDAVIDGDLIIADGVEGDILLEDTVIKGNLIVRGGSVNIKSNIDEIVLGNVVVDRKSGEGQINIGENIKINNMIVLSKFLIDGEGSIESIYFKDNSSDSKVNVDKVDVNLDEGITVLDKDNKEILESSLIN